ncbi:hypothetical protein AB0M95_26105 [Sphaerisporangium sp. NPDC051017]|uniref:hypothetical protein n=1 Tax=Sphaerisporangium sp. NPDC051017 TaxID=3154636 RepID=UPI00343B841A
MAPHDHHTAATEQIGIDFGSGRESITLKERFDPFVAPLAVDAGAVTKDPQALEIARAVYAAFGDLDNGSGLTRNELIAACVPRFSSANVASRINVFIGTRMLLANDSPDRQHQERYRINDMSAVALLVFGRLDREGGIEEITLLLSRTTREIEDGLLTEAEVSERITEARQALAVTTTNLLRLVRDRTIEELLEERRSQRSAAALLTEAKTLVTVVADRFHQQMGAGQRLIRAASRYCEAVGELWDRLVRLASTRRDFSMLSPEQYRTAAQRSSAERLAEVFSRTVFDPPSLTTNAERLIDAVDEYRPRPPRRRPPPSAASPSDRDPVSEARQRAELARARRIANIERALQGRNEVDLTDIIRAAGRPGAIQLVVQVLLASAAPDIPLTATLSTAILTDPVATVSFVTPVWVHRGHEPSPVEVTTTDVAGR